MGARVRLLVHWLAVGGVIAGGAGCSNDLPPASFIDKLRVLAVRAEPPEIAPGHTAALDVLAVEPFTHANPQISAKWSACALPPSGVTVAPCGLGSDAGLSGVQVLAPPTCSGTTTAIGCPSSYTAPADLLGSASSTEVLLTVVVADELAGGADGCVASIIDNGGLPTNPDHCVVSLKRLSISTQPSNHNPALADFTATAPHGQPEPIDDSGNSHWQPAAKRDADQWDIIADRSDAAAERKADGTYEALSVSWFTTAGHFDGGRSIYLPPGCNDPAACATQLPETGADTTWYAPTDAEAMGLLGANNEVHFWAVIRDDRGGVGWRDGGLVR
jgi:hypothetical protein